MLVIRLNGITNVFRTCNFQRNVPTLLTPLRGIPYPQSSRKKGSTSSYRPVPRQVQSYHCFDVWPVLQNVIQNSFHAVITTTYETNKCKTLKRGPLLCFRRYSFLESVQYLFNITIFHTSLNKGRISWFLQDWLAVTETRAEACLSTTSCCSRSTCVSRYWTGRARSTTRSTCS